MASPRLERLDDAVMHYRRALALRPDYAVAHFELGVAMERQGDVSTAMEHYRAALELDASYPSAHNGVGFLLAEQGHLEDAITHYEEAIRFDPEHEPAHNNYGVALARLNRIAEAADHFAKALEIDPDSQEARRNLEHAEQVLLDRGVTPAGFGWRLVFELSAHSVLILKVETGRLHDANAIAQLLVEPIKRRYVEVLVYFYRTGSPRTFAATRVQWSPHAGYVETTFPEPRSMN